MPRYYCDYCDTYLTHDSPSVRKQHNAGYKHKANVRSYYQQFEEQQTQSLIDQKVKEHLGQTAAYQQQVGAAFHQHLTTLQYKPPISAPVLPPPPLPIPGTASASSAPPLLPTVRPPVLPRPTGAPPGFGVAPTFRPPVGSTLAQSNGLPRPPTLAPPGAPGVRPVMSSSTAPANGPLPGPPHSGPPGSFQQQSTPSSGSFGNYSYPAPQLGSSAGYMAQRPNLTPNANSTSTPTPTPAPTSTLNPNVNPTYSSQQPSRVAPPAGPAAQGNLTFGQGTFGPSSATQSTSSSYGPSPPGGPVGFRS